MVEPEGSDLNRSGIWRALLAAILLGPSVWVWVTRGEVLLAGHPAYPILVTVAGAAGLILVALAIKHLRAGASSPAPRARRRRRWLVVLGGVLAALLAVVVAGSVVYLRPFGVSADARGALSGSAAVIVDDSPTRITLTPAGADATTIAGGLIFQPGARVDPRAYVSMLSRLGAQGVLVVIIKQPLDIGFTATEAPAGIIADHPEVQHWVVGGHSLGGVAASSYAEGHPGQVGGLLLWASYPLGSLAARTDLSVTSVSGTEDGLATPPDIEASRTDLPADTTYVAVPGGVHAFFGDYGPQPGDGTPTTSRSAAQDQIVAASLALVEAVARS